MLKLILENILIKNLTEINNPIFHLINYLFNINQLNNYSNINNIITNVIKSLNVYLTLKSLF